MPGFAVGAVVDRWFGWALRARKAQGDGTALAGGLFVVGYTDFEGGVLDFDLALHA